MKIEEFIRAFDAATNGAKFAKSTPVVVQDWDEVYDIIVVGQKIGNPSVCVLNVCGYLSTSFEQLSDTERASLTQKQIDDLYQDDLQSIVNDARSIKFAMPIDKFKAGSSIDVYTLLTAVNDLRLKGCKQVILQLPDTFADNESRIEKVSYNSAAKKFVLSY